MSDKPLVSVVVPICNVEKYIERCLESLKKQSLRDIEIICVDDGSADRSGDIADSFAKEDARFIVIHKENSGYGNTMNIGISKASADYVAILESDDFAAEEMLEKLYDAAFYSDAEIVKSNYFSYRGEENEAEPVNITDAYIENEVFSPDECLEFMLNNPSVWNAIYKKDFLEKNEIRFLESPGASYQDVGFLCKCWFTVNKIRCIQDHLVYYRTDNPGSSVKNRRKVYCVCDEYAEVRRYLNEHKACFHRARKVLAQMMYTNYFHSYHRIDFPFKYGFVTKWREDTLWLKEHGYMDEQAILCREDRESMDSLMEDLDSFYDNISEYNWFMAQREYWEAWGKVFDTSIEFIADEAETVLQREQEIMIFGAGKVAVEAVMALKDKGLTSKLSCFIVTEKRNNPKDIQGIPVYGAGDISAEKKDVLILTAVTIKSQREAIETLKESGYRRIMPYAGCIRERLKTKAGKEE